MIVLKTNVEEILLRKQREYIDAVILKMAEAGELCLTNARNTGSYTDRTGNLRASVGYVVIYNGKIMISSNISDLNRETVNKAIKDYPKDIVLIVVAGRNYAVYVEARKYNVLTSAELLAEKIVPQLLSELK